MVGVAGFLPFGYVCYPFIHYLLFPSVACFSISCSISVISVSCSSEIIHLAAVFLHACVLRSHPNRPVLFIISMCVPICFRVFVRSGGCGFRFIVVSCVGWWYDGCA